jgi:hypothetical protein
MYPELGPAWTMTWWRRSGSGAASAAAVPRRPWREAACGWTAPRSFWPFDQESAWDDEPDGPLQADYDKLDDVARTVGEVFLGTALGFARCHDHRFDPNFQEVCSGVAA